MSKIKTTPPRPLFQHEPACMTCKHYHGGFTCTAFPDGIPQEILYEKNNHRAPFPGDHGIQYEKESEA